MKANIVKLLLFIVYAISARVLDDVASSALPPPGPTNWVVRLLDSYTFPNGQSNYLFRGNLPLTSDTEFNYDGLVSIMSSKVSNFPQGVYIIDIALQYDTFPDKAVWITTESNFFSQNPILGEFIHWPLLGDLYSPNDDGTKLEQDAITLRKWQIDDVRNFVYYFIKNLKLPKKLQNISDVLHTQRDKPIAIYFHCHTGSDRTGEFAISYSIGYLNYTWHEAAAISESICTLVNGRDMDPFNVFGANWYCYYLYYAKGMKSLGCSDPTMEKPVKVK